MGPPSFITCFVCQKGFGSHSIHIHVPSCLEKWHVENDKKRKSERASPPSPPPHYPVQLRPELQHSLPAPRRPRPITAKLEKPKQVQLPAGAAVSRCSCQQVQLSAGAAVSRSRCICQQVQLSAGAAVSRCSCQQVQLSAGAAASRCSTAIDVCT
ncbi:uncharacterized protein LOC108678472 [Hyalella azteca]|uniref:Uncharacterized protein LOC108678472 n=1 Tax=Hyalella azteca TaxID=294128 RepID=A0A979FTF0_HYAAZ|nr:uncharacterized protein LOC108678472 [Hyalella azteca]